ncbi:hypothetical protein BJ684DRAFT_16834 [Piptocephalis cylindrospora]|uniref:Ubiquitin-related modifier 1 n=1 Tax=Piptocephalis cylindrospora TaxID=1907219 RepID=A0A4P9Y1L2_9FUNG|nr:hypothetical protein BJ684DRAFT_16834 [Piptocephalis cylindrospora]|eukprot:RKP12708.1 hypothetical protein BJ684DRAFT_16834 [Piptocephalis cylindrospora]
MHFGACGRTLGGRVSEDRKQGVAKARVCGGMELLFDGLTLTKATVQGPQAGGQVEMRHVIAHVKDHLLTERPDLFVSGETVRPGILVLINDSDWEIEGQLDYEVQNGDVIVFISTLHGG